MFHRFFTYSVIGPCLAVCAFVCQAAPESILTHIPDDVEIYASHSIDENNQLLVHIDPLTQALVVSAVTSLNSRFDIREQYRSPPPDADVETLCVFQDTQGIGAFVFDARGMASQQYLYLQSNAQWRQVAIRDFSMGGEPEYCMVDNASGQIYIAEEGIGVWQMSVAPESELTRYLSPLELDEDTVSIALISAEKGELSDEMGRVHSFNVKPPDYQRGDLPMLIADGQTDPVQRFGDAADDPAIWVNNETPGRSLIIGTDKKAGLDVFDLNGKRLQHLPIGKVNNVDVRQSVQFGENRMDLAVASNRSGNLLSVFAINGKNRSVTHIGDVSTPLNDIYGLCLYQPEQGLEVLVNDTGGTYLRYALTVAGDTVSASLMEQFNVPSQPEGCVADDKHQQLFYGEEASGIWLRSLAGVQQTSTRIAGLSDSVHADIEGMDIYHVDGKRYLVASSQGNDSYAVYAIDNDFDWLGSFRITADIENGIDGASETDGLAISSVNLGSRYPQGLLVVQDGRNVMPSDKQNFKLVSGSKLAEFIRKHR